MLKGIIPILPTPFNQDGELDVGGLRNLVDYLIEKGVHGLGTLALASESYKLTEAERGRVVRTVVTAADGRVPVVVGSDHTGTYGAVQRSREAQALGAEAIMVLPPYFVRPDRDGLYRHYAAISTAVDVPVVVQDSPGLTGVQMSASFLVRMATELERIRYVKIEGLPAGLKISAVVRAAGDKLGVMCGWGGLTILDALRRGAIGCMPGADLAPMLVRVYEAFVAGHIEEAAVHFEGILPLLTFAAQSLDTFVIVAKEILARQGIIATATVREPCMKFDQVYRAELEELLKHVSLS